MVTPVGLGTWVFGGWPWNESSDKDSESALEAALDLGVCLIDTAPIYGCGRAERIIGRTLKRLKKRDDLILSSKFGLCWEEGKRKKIWKDASSKNLLREIDDSLKRLETDRIDIYHLHWPDEKTPIGETMETLLLLKEKKKIGKIGLSNFNLSPLQEACRYAPVEVLQVPYNYFARDIEKEILPFCIEKNIVTLTYGTLCKGLLTGKFSGDKKPNDPVRNRSWDAIFAEENYEKCLNEIETLKIKAAVENLTLAQWAIRWTMHQPGVTCALIGARNAKQVRENFTSLSQESS